MIVLLKNNAYSILDLELARVRDGEANARMNALTSLANPTLDWISIATGLGVPASRAVSAEDFHARFKAAMNEDFGTPEAVAVLFDLASEVNRSHSSPLAGLLKALGGVLGLVQADPQSFLQSGSMLDDAAIQLQIQARALAKQAKNFAEADRIRNDAQQNRSYQLWTCNSLVRMN